MTPWPHTGKFWHAEHDPPEDVAAYADNHPAQVTREGVAVPRYPDPVARPNIRLAAARRRTPFRARPGHHMSRDDLADAVNAALDRLTATDGHPRPHIDKRWITKLERGEHRWLRPEIRAALRHLLGAATNDDLGLRHPVHGEP